MEQQGTCGLDFEGGPGQLRHGRARVRGRAPKGSCSPSSRPSSTSSRCSASSAQRDEAARLMALRDRHRASHRARPTSSARCCCSTPTRSCSTLASELAAAVRGSRAAPAARGASALLRMVGRRRIRCRSSSTTWRRFDLDKRSRAVPDVLRRGRQARARAWRCLRLKRLYRAAGLPLQAGELPDYLPVMLEFAAAAPPRLRRASCCASTAPRSSSCASACASAAPPTRT